MIFFRFGKQIRNIATYFSLKYRDRDVKAQFEGDMNDNIARIPSKS